MSYSVRYTKLVNKQYCQAVICSTHKIAHTYEAMSSKVLQNSLLKKRDQSDVKNTFNLQISTLSLASIPSICLPFTQPFSTKLAIIIRNTSKCNFTYSEIDDVFSINNPDFENYLSQMYPAELEIKEAIENNTSASYLDLILSIGRDGQLRIFL